MEGKQSILLHIDTIKANLEALSDFQAGVLIKSIVAYETGDDFDIQDPLVKLAFGNIKLSLDYARDKYNERCEKNRENIKRRWERTEYDRINRNTNEYEALPTNTNPNTNIESTTKVVDEKECKEKEKETRFVKPTIQEVYEYFAVNLQCHDKAEAEEFYYHYESNGWKVGENKMKKWHAAASGWHSRENKKKQSNFHGTDRQTYEQQLGQALAQQCADRRQRELTSGTSSQGGVMPPKL